MVDPVPPPMERVRALVERYRTTCLWYLREDWTPQTEEEAIFALDAIARHGDVAAFQQAAELRTWLSRPSNSPSAA